MYKEKLYFAAKNFDRKYSFSDCSLNLSQMSDTSFANEHFHLDFLGLAAFVTGSKNNRQHTMV